MQKASLDRTVVWKRERAVTAVCKSNTGLNSGWILKKILERNSARSDDSWGGLGILLFEGCKAGNFVRTSAFDFNGDEVGTVANDEIRFDRPVSPIVDARAGSVMLLN